MASRLLVLGALWPGFGITPGGGWRALFITLLQLAAMVKMVSESSCDTFLFEEGQQLGFTIRDSIGPYFTWQPFTLRQKLEHTEVYTDQTQNTTHDRQGIQRICISPTQNVPKPSLVAISTSSNVLMRKFALKTGQ